MMEIRIGRRTFTIEDNTARLAAIGAVGAAEELLRRWSQAEKIASIIEAALTHELMIRGGLQDKAVSRFACGEIIFQVTPLAEEPDQVVFEVVATNLRIAGPKGVRTFLYTLRERGAPSFRPAPR